MAIQENCSDYWQHADWMPPDTAIAYWCGVDPQALASMGFKTGCMEAKLQALLGAVDRGEVRHKRSDGRDFKDPAHDLYARGSMLIERESFDTWRNALSISGPDASQNALAEPTAKSRNAYLRTISAMAGVLIGGLTGQHQKDAEAICACLELNGTEGQVGRETLAKYLREASTL